MIRIVSVRGYFITNVRGKVQDDTPPAELVDN